MESPPYVITPEVRFFLEPASPAQRQYEALRAYFLEDCPSPEVATRFGYTSGSFRVLCHHFRRCKPDFFRELRPGPHTQPKKNAVRDLILAMRKQNLSIYDIEKALKERGTPLSCTAIWEILHEEGFSRLPRRADEERPDTVHPDRERSRIGAGPPCSPAVSRPKSAACFSSYRCWWIAISPHVSNRPATPAPR